MHLCDSSLADVGCTHRTTPTPLLYGYDIYFRWPSSINYLTYSSFDNNKTAIRNNSIKIPNNAHSIKNPFCTMSGRSKSGGYKNGGHYCPTPKPLCVRPDFPEGARFTWPSIDPLGGRG